MMPVGHVAYTWAALTWLQGRGCVPDIDYRAAAFAALLPDLLDKPLSLTLLSHSGTSQGIGHTLLAQAALTSAVAVGKPDWLPYALIVNGHLLADQMWKYRRTLFFPFSGRWDSWQFMGSPRAMARAYAKILSRPSILAAEAVGLALLGWVALRGRWYRRAALKRFLRTGRLRVGKEEPRCG